MNIYAEQIILLDPQTARVSEFQVIAPSEAGCLLMSESPGQVRVNRLPGSSVGLMAERGNPRTRWVKPASLWRRRST